MVFYRRKKSREPHTLETVIGYPELADRLAVVRDGLEPVVVETLKYFLHLKAEEANPDREIIISYQCRETDPELPPGDLEFHLYGLKEGEVAVMKVPRQLYEKTAADYKRHPKTELFSSLRVGSYLSVKNMMRGEE
jgi:hypothetical protein